MGKKALPPGIKKNKPDRKLTRDEFLKLDYRKQLKYLEIYPKSSFRFLINKPGSNTKKAKREKPEPINAKKDAPKGKGRPRRAAKDEAGGESKVEKARKIRRRTFDALSDEQKQEYLKQFPKSVHGKDYKKETPEPEIGKALVPYDNPKLMRHNIQGGTKVIPAHGIYYEKEERAKRVQEHKDVEDQIQTLNKDGAAVINPHSIKAIANIQPRHLKIASHEIDRNRHEIIDAVAERVNEHPKLFDRGLKALGKVFSGAQSLRPKELRASKRVLVQIASVALLSTSVLAMSMGAAPLAVVTGRMLYDIWMNNHGRNKKDTEFLPRLKRKEEPEDAPEQDKPTKLPKKTAAQKTQKEIDAQPEKAALPAPSRKPNSQKALPNPQAKLPSPKWAQEEAEDAEFAEAASANPLSEEHEGIVSIVLDQLTDLLKYQSADDIKSLSGKMFAKAGSEEELYVDVYNAVSKLALDQARLSGVPGKFLSGMFRVNIQEIVEIVERIVQVEPEVEVEEGITAYHFNSPRGLVTVGVCPDQDFIQFIFTEPTYEYPIS